MPQGGTPSGTNRIARNAAYTPTATWEKLMTLVRVAMSTRQTPITAYKPSRSEACGQGSDDRHRNSSC